MFALRLDGDAPISSSRIREHLAAGEIAAANRLLGGPYLAIGRVVEGDRRGRTIGFPTANIDVDAGMIPRHGVYAGWLTVLDGGGNARAAALVGQRMPAAISLGINYTVGGDSLRVEAFVIDGAGLDLYDARVALDLVDWRRPMLDFGSVEALTEALAEDVAWCREALGMPAPA